jgi:dienelactone hydrolase
MSSRSKGLQIFRRGFFLLVLLLTATMAIVPSAAGQVPPTPPDQPLAGPGGVNRPYADVVATRFGERPTGYWLFEPLDEGGERLLEPQPLVIFMHGFTAVDPQTYRAWIDHIVRGGAVVIYPDYQRLNPFRLDPDQYLDNAIVAIRDALPRLDSGEFTSIDLDRVAIVGHSAGAVLSVNYAAAAPLLGLPVPVAVMAVEPGGCRGCGGMSDQFGMELVGLESIAPETYVLVIVGEDDWVVGSEPGKEIWSQLDHIPLDQRDFITIRTDRHGTPSLNADHFFPLTSGLGDVNALDWYGTWKLFDGLMSCALDGEVCDSAIGNTEFQTFMGTWSDGTPVTPALVTSFPLDE